MICFSFGWEKDEKEGQQVGHVTDQRDASWQDYYLPWKKKKGSADLCVSTWATPISYRR